MRFLISQIFGFTALFFSCEAVFKKNKFIFFVMEALVDIFYALSFFMLNVWGAGILSLISMLAMMIIYYLQKNNSKFDLPVLLIFVGIQIIVGLLFAVDLLDIFLIASMILFTVGFYLKNLQLTRFFIFIPNLIMIFYDIFCFAYANALLDIIETTVVFIALIKFYIEEKHIKTKANIKKYKINLFNLNFEKKNTN